MKTPLKYIILLAIYGAALYCVGLFFTEENVYNLSVEGFLILTKFAPFFFLWGLVKLETFCLYRGWLPDCYTEQMASFGYHSPDYYSNKDVSVERRDS